MKRLIRILLSDGESIDLELSKIVTIDMGHKMIHLDQLKDGKWRLSYNERLIPDISKVERLELIREED